jgi:transcriptional regulator with XRE-family HTH domain
MRKLPTAADEAIAVRLRLRRKELGMSQEKLGQAVGVSFQQIQKYERGTNRIGAGNLTRLAEALGVNVGYFFEGLDKIRNDGAHTLGIDVLAITGASELVRAYARIGDPKLRRVVVDLAKRLASVGSNTNASPVEGTLSRSGASPR